MNDESDNEIYSVKGRNPCLRQSSELCWFQQNIHQKKNICEYLNSLIHLLETEKNRI